MVADAQMLENIAEVGLQIVVIFCLIFETAGLVTFLWKHLVCVGLPSAHLLKTGLYIRAFRALSNWALCICSEGGSTVSLGSLFQCLELSCHHIPEHGFFPPRTQFLLTTSLDSFLPAFLSCRIPAPWCGPLLLGPALLGVGSAALREALISQNPLALTLHDWENRVFSGTSAWQVLWKWFPSIQVQTIFNLCSSAWSGNCAASVCISYFNIARDVFFNVLSLIKSFGEFWGFFYF